MDTFEDVKPILEKIFISLKKDPSKLVWTRNDGYMSWFRIETATCQHLFGDRPEQFGIEAYDGFRLRDYVQYLGTEDNAWGYIEKVYETFGEFLDGEPRWRMEDISRYRIEKGLPKIDVPCRD